jgi:hypothetical protein
MTANHRAARSDGCAVLIAGFALEQRGRHAPRQLHQPAVEGI